jgi:hypothetical protein
VAHQFHRRVEKADHRPSKRLGRDRTPNRHPNGRSRTARCQDVQSYPQVSGDAPTRNAPSVLANEAVSVPRAQRSGPKHRSQVHLLCGRLAAQPSLNVVPCHTACRFYRLECRIPPSAPPNTALQLTAARARSSLFDGIFQRARGS